MSAEELTRESPETPEEIQLEGGTYEVITRRLENHGRQLRERLDSLHHARKEVFGAVELALRTTERITTEHNCEPRDMVVVGSRLLFGYNVRFGLKIETVPADVFASYEYVDGAFQEKTLDLIRDERFESDFRDLYRYYRNTVFVKFAVIGPHLFMVFRIGKSPTDIKTFKWALDGSELKYLDNRSDHEFCYPPQHDFEWKRTHRDLHRGGTHPHISIEDRIFVETMGGDLTIKIENNTESGEGIYAEGVDDPDQTLDDAEIYYAELGSTIILKVRPYRELDFRYIAYNDKIQRARRLDAIGDSCVLLPEDQGIIFSNGYQLQSGESKTFESALQGMLFEKRLASPNGEDYVYVFYNRESGVYILLPYNIIDQKVETPIICHGHAFFESGDLILFKAQDTPQKHHAIQVWNSPFSLVESAVEARADTYLAKIGNRELVRGMAECQAVLNLIGRGDEYARLYVDLVKETGDILDSYFWLGHEETFNLRESLEEIRSAASAAVSEFEKVIQVRRATANELSRVSTETEKTLKEISYRRFEKVEDFVHSLASLRTVRGQIITLRDRRFIDGERVGRLEERVQEEAEKVARRCVEYLLRPEALNPYRERVEVHRLRIDTVEKAREARDVEEAVDRESGELELLIETVSNLKIDDATQRTAIIDGISAIFSILNQVRAALKNRIQELASVEGAAEFGSQLKLLNQAVVNYLDVCDSPEKCEEYLTRAMVQIEELEGKFSEFDEFLEQLAQKRDEIYGAFDGRRVALVEKRGRRAAALGKSAERILHGLKNRVDKLESIDEINGFFASDLLVEKVRDIVRQLGDMEETVRVDDVQGQLKTIREDAVRQLKDRQDLYGEGGQTIQLGRHRFSVNVQELDLTTVLRDGELYHHLTGTRYFEAVEDEELLSLKDLWEREIVSESPDVYRAEYLAHLFVESLGPDGAPARAELRALGDDELRKKVHAFMGPRYSEGYVKGVHDHDAGGIVRALLELDDSSGLMRFHTRARALARVFWHHLGAGPKRDAIQAKLGGLGSVLELFPVAEPRGAYVEELQHELEEFVAGHPLFESGLAGDAAEYLRRELVRGDGAEFQISREAGAICRGFRTFLERKKYVTRFGDSMSRVRANWPDAFVLLRDWIAAYIEQDEESHDERYIDEVAATLLSDAFEDRRVVSVDVERSLDGLLGSHSRIERGSYHLDFPDFRLRLRRFASVDVPRFERFVRLKKGLVDRAREELRLEEFRPRVLTSFVRNRLIDEVYLHLIGENLAKQIGVVGENKRTDLMGLLLLISPPGYGKTTLMEYLANRLGIIFMKINGPAIGHAVTSLDPAEVSNAAAREELEKLNLSLVMGDNVMIYLDDIQHTNPEFLQKFISLCDAQRKIEGVYRGRTRTYDLRGRKVVVVMAGNPYTESGEKFQIPDMLANRADIYNLGEIIGDAEGAFISSYLENSLTSNPVMSRLASQSQSDVHALIRMAESESEDPVNLEGNYSLEEIQEFVATLRKLLRVREVILSVNREYIRSAGMSDEYRTEPPFKLQGSYRNMNRIAEKVLPVMNDRELETLIFSSYEQDAQTLTTGAEANLLKFKELTAALSEDESRRWESVKATYQRTVRMRGLGDDKFAQLVLQLEGFNESLGSIEEAITGASSDASRQEAGPAGVPSQEIKVINRVPKVFLNVIQDQFILMRDWLNTIHKSSTRHDRNLNKLGRAVKDALSRYEALIDKLESGETSSSAMEASDLEE